MKRTFAVFLLISSLVTSCDDKNKSSESTSSAAVDSSAVKTEVATPGYDSLLAAQCGGDEYGMRKYVMVILQQGTGQEIDEASRAQVQQAHLNRIQRMADEGKLLIAGPFLDDGFNRGIFILNTGSLDTARMWTATDPAVKLGQLQMELHEWYGSAALMKVYDIHKSIQKRSITR